MKLRFQVITILELGSMKNLLRCSYRNSFVWISYSSLFKSWSTLYFVLEFKVFKLRAYFSDFYGDCYINSISFIYISIFIIDNVGFGLLALWCSSCRSCCLLKNRTSILTFNHFAIYFCLWMLSSYWYSTRFI